MSNGEAIFAWGLIFICLVLNVVDGRQLEKLKRRVDDLEQRR